jgi:ribosome biogenesis protein MAK21
MVVEKQKRRRGKKNSDGHTGNTHVKDDTSASGYKPHNSFLINISEEEAPMWYECAKSIPGRDDSIFDVETPSTNTQNTSLARKYRSLADEIYRAELSLTGATSSGGKAASDERWVENTMKRGTLKDRIAATSVLVSTDPVHKLSSLDNLLSMAGCTDAGQSNSRVAQMAAEALEDLFLNTLFPPGRKLLSLEQRPLSTYEASSNMTLSPRVLLLWRFEEMLKERFQSFLNGYLVATLRDGMDLNKTFALRTAGTMLRSTPEGEAQLLSMMVNKLGDPGKKIAASAGHELRRVLEEHDNMQEIAAREVCNTRLGPC